MSPIADPLPAIFEERIAPFKTNGEHDSPFLDKQGKDGQMNHRQISIKSEASGQGSDGKKVPSDKKSLDSSTTNETKKEEVKTQSQPQVSLSVEKPATAQQTEVKPTNQLIKPIPIQEVKTEPEPVKAKPEDEKKIDTSQSSAPTESKQAKPAPAAIRPRRRVKPKVEKKKEPKVIEVVLEADGEIIPGKTIYMPEVDLKEALDLPVVDNQDLIIINSLIKLGVDFVSVGGVETKDDLNEVKDLLSVKGRHIKILAKL